LKFKRERLSNKVTGFANAPPVAAGTVDNGLRAQKKQPWRINRRAALNGTDTGALVVFTGEIQMTEIKEHMEVIGADGVHVGTVDKIEGNRIKLTKKDSGEGSHKGHHHYIDRGLVAGVEGNKVRLSATGAVAVTMEEEKN
jgi:hypothetical protein